MADRTWTWRHAVLKSSLPATTRHVLLTISCFMNEVGGGCYPTTKQIADATGLSERSVCTHIDVAAKAGWIRVSQHGFRGQGWRNNQYEAAWPDGQKGTEPASAPEAEALNLMQEGTEPDDRKALKEVQSILPDNIPINTSAREAGGVDSIEREFEDVWLDFPRHPNSRRFAALKSYRRLSPKDRVNCIRGGSRYAIKFEEDRSDKRSLDERLRYVPHLSTWINQRGWEAELEAAA